MGVIPSRRLVLPTNPNGVTFAADARDVLGARGWSDVLRLAARPLQRFHAASGLPAAARLGWRLAEGRERPRHELTLLFVVDGPASAADLGVLEAEVATSPVFWSRSSIERVPPHAVPALLASGGDLHQLWTLRDDAPVLQRLVLGERGVRIDDRPADATTPSDLLPDVVHAIGLPVPIEALDADVERMRLVFAHTVTEAIVRADGIVQEEEAAFLRNVFPEELMRRLGIHAGEGRARWLEEAHRRLPVVLGHHDKLAMIGLFFAACYSDGSLDAREVSLLREAGERLGLTRPQVVDFLRRYW